MKKRKFIALQLLLFFLLSLSTHPIHAKLNAQEIAQIAEGTTPDLVGIGWEIKNGNFASAACRVAVEQRAGWRIIAGNELEKYHNTAEVGFYRINPDIYITIIAERVGGINEETHSDIVNNLYQSWMAPVKNRDRLSFVVGDRKIAFESFQITEANSPFEYLIGSLVKNDYGYQILCRYQQGTRDFVVKDIAIGLASIRFLDSIERTRLANKLVSGVDTQNKVGSDFSLIRGIYRNFTHGILWKKPPGFWRILVGPEIDAEDKSLLLNLKEPTRGLFGLLTYESNPKSGNPKDFHIATVYKLTGKKISNSFVAEKNVSNVPLYISETYSRVGSGGYAHNICTFKINDIAYNLYIHGFSENVSSNTELINVVHSNLQFVKNMKAVKKTKRNYTDVRLGFSINLDKNKWEIKDVTPDNIRSIASTLELNNNKEKIYLYVVNAYGNNQLDIQLFDDILMEHAKNKLNLFSYEKSTRKQIEFIGYSANLTSYYSKPEKVYTIVFKRDNTFFGVIMIGEKSYTMRNQFESSLSFIR